MNQFLFSRSCLARSGLLSHSEMRLMCDSLATLAGGVFDHSCSSLSTLALRALRLRSSSSLFKKSLGRPRAVIPPGFIELDLLLWPSPNLTLGEIDLVLLTYSKASDILLRILWCLALRFVASYWLHCLWNVSYWFGFISTSTSGLTSSICVSGIGFSAIDDGA